MSFDFKKAEKLLALATNAGTTEEERRSAAMKLARMLADTEFFADYKKITDWSRKVLDWLKKNEKALRRQGFVL